MISLSDPVAVWFLRPGLLLPTPSVLAVLNLERAGHRLTLTTDGAGIHVEPAKGIPVDPHDLAELRRWKAHALLFLRYTPDDAHLISDDTASRPTS